MNDEHREYHFEGELSLEIVEREWKGRLVKIDEYIDLLHLTPATLDVGIVFAFTLDGKVVAGVGVGTKEIISLILDNLRQGILRGD